MLIHIAHGVFFSAKFAFSFDSLCHGRCPFICVGVALLGAFEIDGTRYEVMPDRDFFWGEPPKSMNYKLKTVLEKGMTMEYEYDFGSTTELRITVVNYQIRPLRKEKLTILS